jgi:hypothetical protein
MKKASILLAVALFCTLASFAQTVSPFMGLGNAQFFDNNGEPLVAGVLYSYQAGTSTQQATYTDSTGLVLNPNPLPFGSGARTGIWLLSSSYYKFVLCLQNDGANCAPADVLFSVDQVPGSPAGSGGGSGSPFISASANPATTGILRLATADSICWRNAANSANLCISKDSNDVLSWAGNAMKFPELGCSNTTAAFDYLCASSTNHRWMMANNGGAQAQIAAAGVDINTSDQVTQLHFGATAEPLGTAPTTNQNLCWNGTNIVGCTPNPFPITIYSTASAITTSSIGSTLMTTAPVSGATYRLSAYGTISVIGTSCTGTSVATVDVVFTDINTGSATWLVSTLQPQGGFNGSLGPMTPIGVIGTFRAKTSTNVSYLVNWVPGTGCSPGQTYQIFPVLEQLSN